MFLALREMRRAVVRFGLLVAAIGLLVFLILFQQALQDGLLTSFVGAIRNQSAPVLVYSVDAQRTLQGSTIPPELERQVRGAEGVGRSARLNQSTFTIRIGEEGDSDAAIIGTDDQELVRPTTLTAGRRPEREGEAVGSDGDFRLGARVAVVGSPGVRPAEVTVVGLAEDLQLSVTPTLFTDLDTFRAASMAVNPGATAMLPNAIAVAPADGASAERVAASINSVAPDADALTRGDAADNSPGVAQVRQSFQVIFLLYGLVVPLLTGLFFLIITLQKAGSLTLLRAIGARASVLAGSLLLQVGIVMGLGLAVGVGLFYPLSRTGVGGLSLRFDATAVLAWSALLLGLGLLSALASLRRVLRIDPIEATSGPGVR